MVSKAKRNFYSHCERVDESQSLVPSLAGKGAEVSVEAQSGGRDVKP